MVEGSVVQQVPCSAFHQQILPTESRTVQRNRVLVELALRLCERMIARRNGVLTTSGEPAVPNAHSWCRR